MMTSRNRITPSDLGPSGPETVSNGLPPKQGLYDPWFEHEACGLVSWSMSKGASLMRSSDKA